MSAINYHFESKEKLLEAIFDIYADNNLAQITPLIQEFVSYENLKTQFEMLTLLILNKNLEDIDNYRVVYREVDNRNPLAEDLLEQRVSVLFKTLVKGLKKAKRSKIIKPELDIEIFVSLYLNAIDAKIRTDFIDQKFFATSLDDMNYRKKWVRQLIGIIL